jgi:hypothetical protein
MVVRNSSNASLVKSLDPVINIREGASIVYKWSPIF